jgi:hypothetical protein
MRCGILGRHPHPKDKAMFKFLRESGNDFYDDEALEGLKNFLGLVAMLGISGIVMAGIAYWLGHL